MRNLARKRRSSGFTLLETVVVIALMLGLMLVAVPPLRYMIARNRILGPVRETAMLMQKARLESIKRGVPVVVRLNYDEDRVFAFADVNNAAGDPASDLIFNPQAGAADGETDYPVGFVQLPPEVSFWGPGDGSPEGADAVWQFAPAGAPPNAAVFLSDGTVTSQGAFRLGDRRENFFEVLVSPQTTARVAIRKFDDMRAPGPDGMTFFEQDEAGERWVWKE